MAGCLVAAVGPIIETVIVGVGSDTLYRELGMVGAIGMQFAIGTTFALTGLGLVLAGALAAPVRTAPVLPLLVAHPGEQPYGYPGADTAARV